MGLTWQLNVLNVHVPFEDATETLLEHLMEAYRQRAMMGPLVIIGDINAATTMDDGRKRTTLKDRNTCNSDNQASSSTFDDTLVAEAQRKADQAAIAHRERVEEFRKKVVCCRQLTHCDNITNVLHWGTCKLHVLHADEAAVEGERKAMEGEADTKNKVVHKMLRQ